MPAALETMVLDNPIWHALCTGNRQYASGNERAKFIRRDMGAFAGMPNNSSEELEALHALTPAGAVVVLFTTEKIKVPEGWRTQLEKPLLQMVHHGVVAEADGRVALEPLGEEHIAAMTALVQLTKPGPFLPRTLDFGNYEGIFEQEALVAMTGQRLQPHPYVEVSAVCTHPTALGRGYAALLVQSQVRQIRAAGRIPFLHVYPENTRAVSLYERCGFTVRREMMVYVLEQSGQVLMER